MDWRQDVQHQLQVRNEIECRPFEGVFSGYLSLWREYLRAQAQASELRNQLLIVQHEAQEAISAGDNSAGVQRLTKKLAAVQEELKQRYKDSAESVQEKFALMKRVQELEKIVADLENSNKSHEEAIRLYEEQEVQRSAQMAKIEGGRRALVEEIDSLRKRVDTGEQRIQQLEKENNELLQRMLDEKARFIEEMNQMNQMLEEARESRPTSARWFNRSKSRSDASETVDESRKVGEDDGLAAQWALSSVAPPTQALLTLTCHSMEINDVITDRDGSHFATASSDKTVKLFETATGRLQSEFRGSTEPVKGVDICRDYVLGASNDRSCRIWSIRTGRVHQILTGHANKLQGAKFIGSDGDRVLTGSTDRTMKVWNISANPAKCIQTLRSTSMIMAIDATCDGGTGVSGHQDGSVRFWDLRTGEKVHQLSDLHAAAVTCVAFSPKGEFQLLTSSRDNTLKLIDTRTFETIHTFMQSGFRVSANYSRVCFSPDGSMIAAGSAGGEVVIWDIIGGDVVSMLQQHQDPVVACCWSAKKHLISADKNGIVVVWG